MGSHRRRHLLALAATTLIGTRPLAAQLPPVETVTPLSLPRPGYEPPSGRFGAATIRLQFDLAALYDSNIYATRTDHVDDAIMRGTGRLTAAAALGRNAVNSELYVVRNQHVDVGHESSTSFGALLHDKADLAHDQQFTGTLRYDRAIENRADPEARASFQLSPRKIDMLAAEGDYDVRFSRLSVDFAGAVRSYDFLDRAEHDRDLRTYEGSIRFSGQVAGPLTLFVQPYVTRRDFVRRTDYSGVDRDATTLGALVGLSRELSGTITGRIGAGFFRANSDSPALRPFTGFAANGAISWTPRRRTLVTATVFSGDVATARLGATGRQDTRLNLRVDQEARHNLLVDAGIGWERNRYRGAANADRSTLRVEAGAEYLVSRSFSLFLEGTLAHRTAAVDINSFNRHTVSAGLRLRR